MKSLLIACLFTMSFSFQANSIEPMEENPVSTYVASEADVCSEAEAPDYCFEFGVCSRRAQWCSEGLHGSFESWFHYVRTGLGC